MLIALAIVGAVLYLIVGATVAGIMRFSPEWDTGSFCFTLFFWPLAVVLVLLAGIISPFYRWGRSLPDKVSKVFRKIER